MGAPDEPGKIQRLRLTGKRDGGQGRGNETGETGSVSEEEWFPLRMDIDRRWEEVEKGNPNP